jgi:hypothetical protein
MKGWEVVTEGTIGGSLERTDRLAVPGGWIYRATITATKPNGEVLVAAAVAVDTVFVPDEEPA